MGIAFASDLWQRPDDYEPPVITHDDLEVMRLAELLMNTDPDMQGREPTPWEYEHHGADQDSEYYAEPYKWTIAKYIEWAVALRDALAQPA